MKQKVFIVILFLLGTMRLSTAAPNWVGTFKTNQQCNITACCCVKSPLVINALNKSDASMNISLEGTDCPTTPTGIFNITNHTSLTFIDLNPGNVTIDNDKLTFFIPAGTGAQDPSCAVSHIRQSTGGSNNNNNKPTGTSSSPISREMSLLAQFSSLLFMIMLFE